MINEQLSRIPLFGRTRALSLSKDKTELVISYSENVTRFILFFNNATDVDG